MVVYVGRSYTATLSGSTWKHVTCVNCGHSYGYSATRRATGKGESAFFLDNQGAANRARQRAAANLDRALRSAVEPVKCPNCDMYQADMVRVLKGRRRGPDLVGWSLLSIGAYFSLFAIANGKTHDQLLAWLTLVGIGLCLAAWGLAVRFLYDPNAAAKLRARPQCSSRPLGSGSTSTTPHRSVVRADWQSVLVGAVLPMCAAALLVAEWTGAHRAVQRFMWPSDSAQKPSTSQAPPAPRLPAAKPAVAPSPGGSVPSVPAATPAPSRLPTGKLAGPSYKVEVGAFSDSLHAMLALTATRATTGSLLADHGSDLKEMTRDGRTVFRARFAGFDEETAQRTCAELRRLGRECIVVSAD